MKYIKKFNSLAEYQTYKQNATFTTLCGYMSGNNLVIDQYTISTVPPNDEIWYTSTNNQVVNPYVDTEEGYGFNVNIVSNTYSNGKGVIKFDGSLTRVGFYTFSESSISSISLPDSVTSIGQGAFQTCDSLTSVSLGNGLTSIDYMAFQECYSLTSVNIPDSVTNIDNNAFNYCESLESVTIGSGVTTIGGYAFSGCLNLTTITSLNTTPPTLGTGVFNEDSAIIAIYVPAASVDAYKAADGWSERAAYIQTIQ